MLKTIVVLLVITSTSASFAQSTPQCPFAPESLSKQFGLDFKPGVPEQGILGKACTYQSKTAKIWIDAGPNPAPNVEMYRKMSNPSGTTWKAVAGDPDKAVHTVPKAGVDPFPSLSYERKGWLVNITVTGVNGKANIESWNAKLAKLQRIP